MKRSGSPGAKIIIVFKSYGFILIFHQHPLLHAMIVSGHHWYVLIHYGSLAQVEVSNFKASVIFIKIDILFNVKNTDFTHVCETYFVILSFCQPYVRLELPRKLAMSSKIYICRVLTSFKPEKPKWFTGCQRKYQVCHK